MEKSNPETLSEQNLNIDKPTDPSLLDANLYQVEKKSFPWKIVLAIIGLLLLGLTLAGFVYRDDVAKLIVKPTLTPTLAPSPTPTATANPTPALDPTFKWEVYENFENGYSIKYPTYWTAYSTSNGYTNIEPPEAYWHEFPPGVAIRVVENSKNQSAEEWANSQQNGYILHFKPIVIDGVEGSDTDDFPGGVERRNIFIAKKGKIYHLSLYESRYDYLLKTMDYMLNSFKFIEASQSAKSNNTEPELQTCGTIQGLGCPIGYRCLLENNFPDAAGSCVPDR